MVKSSKGGLMTSKYSPNKNIIACYNCINCKVYKKKVFCIKGYFTESQDVTLKQIMSSKYSTYAIDCAGYKNAEE